jgi:tetratricopeptide (TPR) repeat protein
MKLTSSIINLHFDSHVDSVRKLGLDILDSFADVFMHDCGLAESTEFSPIGCAVIGKIHSLEGDLVTAHEYFREAHNRTLATELAYTSRANEFAYIKYEFGSFWAAFGVFERAEFYLNEAKILTDNNNLIRLIDFKSEFNALVNGKSSSPDRVVSAVDEIEKSNQFVDISFAHLQLGNYFLKNKKYSEGIKHFTYAQRYAEKTTYNFLIDLIQTSIDLLDLEAGNSDAGKNILTPKMQTCGSPILEIRAFEYIAKVSISNKAYDPAVDSLHEAMSLCEKYNIVEPQIEQSLLLGKIYFESLNNPGRASYFYQKAYNLAIGSNTLGIPLAGIRMRAIKDYIKFFEQSIQSSGLHDQKHSILHFVRGKSWVEFTDIFKFNLIVYHRQLHRNVNAILGQIDLTLNSLNSKQNVLKMKGFKLPNMKLKEITYDDPRYSQDLQDYIGNLKDKTWTGALNIFERKVMSYLYAHCNYNKNTLSKALDFSYSHTLLKMRDLKVLTYKKPY